MALLTVVLVIFASLNVEQGRKYQLPGDGISWADTREGVKAWVVDAQGPGSAGGIRRGDKLVEINNTPIHNATDAARAVFLGGVWSKAAYELERGGETFRTTVILTPQTEPESTRYYLLLVGVLYLFIGVFVLLRRWTAPKSTHFFLFCLVSFVAYSFSYTGKLNLFDWTVYWLDVLALVLQPALFLHFCLDFPERAAFLRGRTYLVPAVYLPAVLLGLVHALVAWGILVPTAPLLTARWALDRVEMIYLAVYFLLAAAILTSSYRRAETPLLKQQLKWVTRGVWLGIAPFAALYAVPYFLGFLPTSGMKASALSLILVPLTFGYAIVRYRLMDVDIIFRRGIAYTLATATIVAVYFVLVALSADFFRASLPLTSRGGWVLAILMTAFLFQPIVNWIQVRLEKFFNPERYDYRRTLLEFARQLTSELHVSRLLDQVAGRLAQTLQVDRLAVILASDGNGFQVVKAMGFEAGSGLDLSFLDPRRPELAKGYLFFESPRQPLGYASSPQETISRLGLHYYLPFKVQDRTLGYLGLGKTRDGDFLSSEDVDLLTTLCGTVSIALENARLYESLEEKARQFQALREFSENIIESVDVGVLASNLEGRVDAWNSSMEKLYGLRRSEAVGRRLEEIFPAELLAELPRANETQGTLSLYKFHLRSATGRSLTVNLSTVPLVGKDGRVLGRLLILDDLTERVKLEEQLVQAEKLSSIGLLAAGVAHEVNTPLAVIASQAQMLARQPSDEESHGRALDKIIKQAFRAAEIVNSLLKFSRVSGSEYAEVDLNRVIRETLALAEPMLRSSKIVVNAQLATPLPGVMGNPGKLQQVFMNLILNARDAMPRGGELTIATESENSTIQVEVSDNGVGIQSEHLNKIFDPFFTTKSASRGTGLGLAVSYGIIREHSGEVRVESAVGKGTRFRLEFPVAGKVVHVG